MKALVIAGTASGVGKTTVTIGLISALRERGLAVQPFKVGPDYIDPSYHALAAGRPCRNLDSWMLPVDALLELFQRATANCDIAIVEGVMGLFDGRLGEDGVGSTAQVAKMVGAPVVLVIDAGKTARSAGALVLGFRTFDPDLRLAGVILNNVGSDRHRTAVCESIESATDVSVLGSLRRDEGWCIPERYLGLVPAAERALDPMQLNRLATNVSESIDLDRVLKVASGASSPPLAPRVLFPPRPTERRVRLGVGRDEAFSFYYQDNLDLLEAWGAEVIPFSPLHDAWLPPDISGVYLGGGFPELFGARLAANRSLLDDLREVAAAGMPIYAECGGLMYIGRELVDADGRQHSMAGIAPHRSTLDRPTRSIGYREVTSRRDSILLRKGESLRAHEFHWSTSDAAVAHRAAYRVDGEDRLEGFVDGNVLASYMHVHFGSDSRLAPRFVEACARWAREGAAIRASHHAHWGTAPEWTIGPLLARHGLPPADIEEVSMGRIEAQAGDRLPLREPDRSLVARLVYASGDNSLAELATISPGAIDAGTAALRRGARIVVDVEMVRAGLNSKLLATLGTTLNVAVSQPDAAQIAGDRGITRSAAGMLALADRLDGAVVAVGNAPTALLALLDLVADGRASPALIVGMPVGFVAAGESKEALMASRLPFITVRGTRGGSALAAAALNHLLQLARGVEEATPVKSRGQGP